MDQLRLALVPGATSVSEALGRFAPGTSAIVVSGSNGLAILSADHILERRNRLVDAGIDPAGVLLGDLGPAGPADPGPAGRRLGDGTDLGDPAGGAPTVERLEGDVAVVAVPEALSLSFGASLVICYCEGEPVHTFSPRQLKDRGRCNNPHGVPVRCEPV